MPIRLSKLAGAAIEPFSILEPEQRDRLMRAAETDVSILLVGETGTGKGQMARAIVDHSFRKDLVEVNCAALPDELLGSELFGHRRGAFTGAISDRKGLLVSSAGKTIFLDEIGEISLSMQRMLLRVVQRSNRTIKPLGADEEIPCPPLRFIFATNRDLEAEVRDGRFREDLLRRIDVVTVRLPSLRERPDLIAGYAARFLDELSRLHRIPCSGIDADAVKALEEFPWPGNVRELKNCLERALVTAARPRSGCVISVRDLALPLPEREDFGIVRTIDVERENIRKALDVANGSVARAVQLLGLSSRGALYYRLKKYGIEWKYREPVLRGPSGPSR